MKVTEILSETKEGKTVLKDLLTRKRAAEISDLKAIYYSRIKDIDKSLSYNDYIAQYHKLAAAGLGTFQAGRYVAAKKQNEPDKFHWNYDPKKLMEFEKSKKSYDDDFLMKIKYPKRPHGMSKSFKQQSDEVMVKFDTPVAQKMPSGAAHAINISITSDAIAAISDEVLATGRAFLDAIERMKNTNSDATAERIAQIEAMLKSIKK